MAEAVEKKTVKKVTEAARRAARSEQAPAPKREYRMLAVQVALVLAVLAFAGLTFLVETTPSFSIDLQITRALQSIDSAIFAIPMYLVSWLGFPPQSYILSALLIILAYVLGLRWEAVMMSVAALSSSLINVLVKALVARPRPTIDLVHVFKVLDSYSFPSGHVMYYVGFYGFLWFLVYTLFQPSAWRRLLLILFGSLVTLVGISRIYLGEHWASDVLGAYLLGGLILVGLIALYRWGKKRFFVRQPVARPETAGVERKPDRE